MRPNWSFQQTLTVTILVLRKRALSGWSATSVSTRYTPVVVALGSESVVSSRYCVQLYEPTFAFSLWKVCGDARQAELPTQAGRFDMPQAVSCSARCVASSYAIDMPR